MREYAAERYAEAYDIVAKAEAEIKQESWVRPKPQDVDGYDKMLQEGRISLRDEGVYDAKALKLMKKCVAKPTLLKRNVPTIASNPVKESFGAPLTPEKSDAKRPKPPSGFGFTIQTFINRHGQNMASGTQNALPLE